jgi:hypothetical protein
VSAAALNYFTLKKLKNNLRNGFLDQTPDASLISHLPVSMAKNVSLFSGLVLLLLHLHQFLRAT